ncbi:MAG TPA: prepilin-type N-terminal cleavage/methylation domain-containing protein [Verrucomicrobiae bacterium]|nr:prepilin-type N-terminal cleavage/methylation domain-containing protein [Verrucomicrobiae bacterium]
MSHIKTQAGFTLVEMMVAVGLGSLVILAAVVFSLYASRSYVAMTNYADLDEKGQLALDEFTQQIRQVLGVTSCTTNNGVINSLTFNDYDGNPLTFTYNPSSKELYRIKSGVTNVLLTGCDSLQFNIYQRTPQPYTFDAITTSVVTNCKLVEVTWSCSRNVLQGDKANTQSVQSSKVAIRSN